MLSKATSTIALPYLISLVGVASDYFTTTLGLGLGYYETNSLYNPVLALAIFWGTLAVLNLALPKSRIWGIIKNIIALASFIGAVNNSLVIIGVFSGLRI